MEITRNILIGALVVTIMVLGFSTFLGGVTTQYGITEPDVSFIDESQNAYSEISTIKSSADNVTGKSSNSISRLEDYVGGTFQTVKLFLNTPSIISAMISSAAGGLQIPFLTEIIQVIFLIFSLLVIVEIIKYWRGIS